MSVLPKTIMYFTRLILLVNFIFTSSFSERSSDQISLFAPQESSSFKPKICYYSTGQVILKPGTNVTRYVRLGVCEAVICNEEAQLIVDKCPKSDKIRSCMMKMFIVPPIFPECCNVCDEQLTQNFQDRIEGKQN